MKCLVFQYCVILDDFSMIFSLVILVQGIWFRIRTWEDILGLSCCIVNKNPLSLWVSVFKHVFFFLRVSSNSNILDSLISTKCLLVPQNSVTNLLSASQKKAKAALTEVFSFLFDGACFLDGMHRECRRIIAGSDNLDGPTSESQSGVPPLPREYAVQHHPKCGLSLLSPWLVWLPRKLTFRRKGRGLATQRKKNIPSLTSLATPETLR